MDPTTAALRSKELRDLFALFPPGDDMPEYEFVAADEVPSPYHRLLVHDQHMTVRVEAHHRDRVDLSVLAVREHPDWYARKILLKLHGPGRTVQFGIMRILWRLCPAAVREEIQAAQAPLGRILIEHDVLRRIEPKAYLRLLPGRAIMDWFGDGRRATYGRLAVIHCHDQPAVDLVEIVAPERTDNAR